MKASPEFRVYEPHELRRDGYPQEWPEINAAVVALAGHRCERCGHPYRKGTHGRGEWSPCDERCTHSGIVSIRSTEPTGPEWIDTELDQGPHAGDLVSHGHDVLAKWRILTVHHMRPGHENKADCRWWNLLVLCQRCHLQIQNKVDPARPWPWEHSEWFRPHAAGFYAWKYGAVEIDRDDADAVAEWLRVGKFEDGVERMPI